MDSNYPDGFDALDYGFYSYQRQLREGTETLFYGEGVTLEEGFTGCSDLMRTHPSKQLEFDFKGEPQCPDTQD